MVRLILGCCLAIIGEGGENGYPVAVGMVVVVETDLGKLSVDGWYVERNNRKRNWEGN
jgi:hypothetical protein